MAIRIKMPRPKRKVQSHKRGVPNKLEAAYGESLELRKREGMILDYKFESFTLRLADRTTYTPDYAVYAIDGKLEFHEVKGFWRDDARVKFKVAAEMYPRHRFISVEKPAWCEWIITEVLNGG